MRAINSPLLETDINGATDAIINVTGGINLTLYEINDAVTAIQNAANAEINVIHGAAINADLEDEIVVTVIATGFDNTKSKPTNLADLRASSSLNRRLPINSTESPSNHTDHRSERDDELEVPAFFKRRFK